MGNLGEERVAAGGAGMAGREDPQSREIVEERALRVAHAGADRAGRLADRAREPARDAAIASGLVDERSPSIIASIHTIVIPALQLTTARRVDRSDRATTATQMQVSSAASAKGMKRKG